jgi:hypothetical protein
MYNLYGVQGSKDSRVRVKCQEAVREWLSSEIELTFRWQGGKTENTGNIAVAMLRVFWGFQTRPAECAANRSRSLFSNSLLEDYKDLKARHKSYELCLK